MLIAQPVKCALFKVWWLITTGTNKKKLPYMCVCGGKLVRGEIEGGAILTMSHR